MSPSSCAHGNGRPTLRPLRTNHQQDRFHLVVPHAQGLPRENCADRRRLLLSTVQLASAFTLAEPQGAKAAAWAGLAAPWNSFMMTQPEPVRVPRKRLTQRFAVLLMRSTYEAVDSLDFMAMDQFQVKFWKLRQAEFEPYKYLYDPIAVPVGDLTSPVYFDFVVFCQFYTISRQIPDAPQVFQEFCEDCEGDPMGKPQYRLVTRSPSYADNSKLPALLQARAGAAIYDGLLNGFQETVFGAPAPCDPSCSIADLAAKAQSLLDVFVANGYAINAKVFDVRETAPGKGTWSVKTDGAAVLWSVAMLRARNALVANLHDALALQAMLEASGFKATFKADIEDQSILQTWTIDRL